MVQPVRISLVFVMSLCAVSPAFSQETQQAPAPAQAQTPTPAYCENNEGFDDWDFWVGDWNVYTNNETRQFVGTNSITKHYHACLLKELWVDVTGNGGFSINYYNPVKSEWRQVWVANGYSIDYTGGLNEQGAMVLEGEIYTYNTNTTARFRGIWTKEENGDVIQNFASFDVAKDNWNLWFEGRYVKKDTDPNPPTSK